MFVGGAISLHQRAHDAFHTYARGLEQALSPDRQYLVGGALSIADICVVAELALFSRERNLADKLAEIDRECVTGSETDETYPRVTAFFDRLCQHEAFAPDVLPYLEKTRATN